MMHPTVRHERALQIYDVTFVCWMVYRFREGSLDFRDSGRSSSVQTRVLVLVMRKWLILAARPADIASVSGKDSFRGEWARQSLLGLAFVCCYFYSFLLFFCSFLLFFFFFFFFLFFFFNPLDNISHYLPFLSL